MGILSRCDGYIQLNVFNGNGSYNRSIVTKQFREALLLSMGMVICAAPHIVVFMKGLATDSIFSMTPYRGNTILLRSSQQLFRLLLITLNGFLT